jgi:hypothetical protein
MGLGEAKEALMQASQLAAVAQEDAFSFIVRYLREVKDVRQRHQGVGSYGYDIYLPNIMKEYLRSKSIDPDELERQPSVFSPSFYAAAWELCRRGILRPGITAYDLQSTTEGSAGNGYSITPAGKAWLESAHQYDFDPLDETRFSKQLEKFSRLFGPGYQERSKEAIRSYHLLLHLACCAMCGAAAESILLRLATEKNADEEKVLDMYSRLGGRKKVEDLLLGDKSVSVQKEFHTYFGLLTYWRDSASHGKASGIQEMEAHMALVLLLKLAQAAERNWAGLTGKP